VIHKTYQFGRSIVKVVPEYRKDLDNHRRYLAIQESASATRFARNNWRRRAAIAAARLAALKKKGGARREYIPSRVRGSYRRSERQIRSRGLTWEC
jgi:hypothetical protein